jgi:hypothetical protein
MDHALEASTSVRWVTQRGDSPGPGAGADGDDRTLAVLQRRKVV